jgi:hypothetical protein
MLWNAVSNRFFGPGNPGRHFKRLAKVFNLRDKVMKAITFRAEAILKPGSHSSSSNPGDFEYISFVDKLAVKLYRDRQIWVDQVEAERLQAATEKEKKQNASDFLVPPPPALGTHNVLSNLSSSSISKSSLAVNSDGSNNNIINNNKIKRNNHDVCDLLDEEDDKKENFLSKMEKDNNKKRKKVVMAGSDAGSLFYAAMAQPDPSMELVAKLFADYQKSEIAFEERRGKEEERRLKVEAAAEERRLKAEERAQHMKLLEMLHEGKISQDLYEAMKP